MLGDTAVAVNPREERYKDIIGSTVVLPIVDREIPVVGDDFVDMLSSAQHMAWHIDSIKKPLETFAEYSYSQSDSVNNLPNE